MQLHRGCPHAEPVGNMTPCEKCRTTDEGMKRGRTEYETCQLNGWQVGDVLEGDEGYGPHRITIRYIGEMLVCFWHHTGREGLTTLSCREWKKI